MICMAVLVFSSGKVQVVSKSQNSQDSTQKKQDSMPTPHRALADSKPRDERDIIGTKSSPFVAAEVAAGMLREGSDANVLSEKAAISREGSDAMVGIPVSPNRSDADEDLVQIEVNDLEGSNVSANLQEEEIEGAENDIVEEVDVRGILPGS
eukprot:gb/GEZN01025055.1/.p1 GENE.gb/GEZN01025055.1/~~gb/GEZN01025055.1/.p1  ORF type:complete len:175 (-),score=27.09 gb/GEZN01025055.1/:30-485(-)